MPTPIKALRGVRILSPALNLPGPAALMRCHAMGARCVKLEPPARGGAKSGDPMAQYCPEAYDAMHTGVRIVAADLKSDAGQRVLQRELAKADVLLTSFRPSALHKLGLGWKDLHRAYPQLSMVSIVGATGSAAELPGHDLTYMAENGLLTGLDLPPTLYADMGGSLMASEAVLQTRLLQLQKGTGVRLEVALSDAAAYLALPRHWGLTTPGAAVGGGHAGYRVYACKNGRVAVAALEPHFARALATAAGLLPGPGLASGAADTDMASMLAPATQTALAAFFAGKTRRQLETLAAAKDIPLHTLP